MLRHAVLAAAASLCIARANVVSLDRPSEQQPGFPGAAGVGGAWDAAARRWSVGPAAAVAGGCAAPTGA